MPTNKLFFTYPQLILWLAVFLLISVLPHFFHSPLAYVDLLLWKAAVAGQVAMLGLLPMVLALRWWKRIVG